MGLARAMRMCHGAAMARKTVELVMGWSWLRRFRVPLMPRVRNKCSRTVAMGKTMPMRPLVRTFRAQAVAKR